MEINEKVARLALALVPGIGGQLVRNLISVTGSASQVFRERAVDLQKVPGIGKHLSASIRKKGYIERAEEELIFMEKEGIRHRFLLDQDYPVRLAQCQDAPIVIFYKGNPEYPGHKWLAVIGTREPTDRGLRTTRNIIRMLADRKHPVVIISGLAYGIDIQAHKCALESGMPTLAVLGHGFHTLYPALHRETAGQILRNGALISDFFSYNTMEPKNFIRRNRIIAGLSDAVLVVESGKKGGAVTTAEMANSYNRDVLAIPGRIDDERSKGCNWLIRSHQAALVESCEDVEYYLGLDSTANPIHETSPLLFELLTLEERQLYEQMPEEPVSIDLLARQQICPVQKVSTLLLSMEFKGFVRALPGKLFLKNR